MARYVDTALRPGEKILYDAKVHWAIFITPFVRLVWVAIIMTGVWYWVFSRGDHSLAEQLAKVKGVGPVDWLFDNLQSVFFLVILGLVGFSSFTHAIIYYFNSDFVLTDRRVISKSGLLSRSTSEQRLSKIESIHVYQSFLGRLLKFGNITVTGTGSSETTFGPMHDPVACKHALEEELDKQRADKRGDD